MISISLDTSQSNLTEISNSVDTLHIRNQFLSPDTSKNQRDIDNKTAPKFSAMLPPAPSPPTTNPTPQPSPLQELKSEELPTNLKKMAEAKMKLQLLHVIFKNLKIKYL